MRGALQQARPTGGMQACMSLAGKRTSQALIAVGLRDAVQQAGVAPRLVLGCRVRRQPRPGQVQRVEQPCLRARGDAG